MKYPRRKFLHLAAAATALPAISRFAVAQTYPTRPVRMVVPSAAGGANDIVGRVIGQWLLERLGQPFVIEDRPGATTNIGTEAVVHAPPDGYTVLVAAAPAAINATFYDKLNFNFLHDIAPVAGIARVPLVMEINGSFPAKTIVDFIANAKANPGKLNMASSGIGSSPHVAGELFKMMTGVDLLHVPYRGEAAALTDLLGGQVQVYFGTFAASSSHVRSRTLRALAVTSATRLDALPDVPPLADFVSGYEASTWYGVGAAKKTPTEIIEKLNKEINAGLAEPKIKAKLSDLGTIPMPFTPAEFGAFVAAETEKWAKVVKFSGAKSN